MKAPLIFRQYLWMVETIYLSNGITLQEFNERWVKTEISGGVPMIRQTFNRHRKAIQDMLGINIECQTKGGYYYYIEDKGLLRRATRFLKQSPANRDPRLLPLYQLLTHPAVAPFPNGVGRYSRICRLRILLKSHF